MNEFDSIRDAHGWRKKLKELLDEAADAAANGDVGTRNSLAMRLTEFMLHSNPDTEEILILDKIADKTSSNLLKRNLDDRVGAIIARTAEYAMLNKEFRVRAEKNKATAEALRFKGVLKTVKALNDSIDVLKELKELIKNESDQSLVTRLDKLSDEIKTVRDMLQDEE